MTNPPSIDMPACGECRRRKLRCSREVPTCKECRRLGAECHYAARENKPGMKPGAVENLNRRVDHLENLIFQLQTQIEPITRDYEQSGRAKSWKDGKESVRTASDLLDSFEQELKRFKSSGPSGAEARSKDRLITTSATSLSPSDNQENQVYETFSESGRKRRRLGSNTSSGLVERVLPFDTHRLASHLTSEELLSLIIDAYFSQVHQWIPMIHQGRFRRRLLTERHEPSLVILLHAMIVAAMKFVELNNSECEQRLSQIIKRSRDYVVFHAMSGLAVESLQALIIVAFDDIGNGDPERAWPIVGSLSRTVEYLRLSVEPENVDEQPMLQPHSLLPSARDWVELEEQRRVFWNIFNLDRFCSITTGWNTSLTSDDFHRCLPVDGILWRKEHQASTPYFGVWDKSAGKIGNSIASLPVPYSSPAQSSNGVHHSPLSSSDYDRSSYTPELSTIGAFAYSIEAMESMSQVTTYFLQQKVNLRNQKQIESWLTRFKELDLRLVHWKKFLPQKWKDPKISLQKSTEYIMDPNLTVAHITHNASMIMLHQLIAYPPATWTWASRLPSRYSADTCKAAAVEIATISQNYLVNATTTKVISNQFVFCLYVAARSLLVHWRYYSRAGPLPEFTVLVESLDEIAKRWHGYLHAQSPYAFNLARTYASELQKLYEKCSRHQNFRLDVLGYVGSTSNRAKACGTQYWPVSVERHEDGSLEDRENLDHKDDSQVHQHYSSPSGLLPPINQMLPASGSQNGQMHSTTSPNAQFSSHHYGHLSVMRSAGNEISNQYSTPQIGDGAMGNTVAMDDHDLNSISQMFFDSQYIDMDRVISYDDGLFNANMGPNMIN